MTAEEIQKVHYAYSIIAATYENVCGGPYKAREYKEYFAAMDSRENLRRRYNEITLNEYGNNTDEQTERGSN